MAIRTVQPGGSIGQAVSIASPGDVIRVITEAGHEYRESFAVTVPDLIIEGMNGRPVLAIGSTFPGPHGETGPASYQGRGLIVQRADRLTLRGLEIYGVDDESGAGVRIEAHGTTVQHCFIHHCDDGILGWTGNRGDVLVEDCELAWCGFVSQTGNSHCAYITTAGTVTFRRVVSHHCRNGMLLKSKSRRTIVEDCELPESGDAPPIEGWTPSQSLDVAWGGEVIVRRTRLQKGVSSDSGCMFKYNANYTQANLVETPALSNYQDLIASGALVLGQGWFPKSVLVEDSLFDNQNTDRTNRFIEDVAVGTSAQADVSLARVTFQGAEDIRPIHVVSEVDVVWPTGGGGGGGGGGTTDAVGFLDRITPAGLVQGWAMNAANRNVPVTVDVIIDGTLAGSVATTIDRPDVNAAMGATGPHGYEWAIPSAFRDGIPHSLTVQLAGVQLLNAHDGAGVDSAAEPFTLSGGAPPPPPPPDTVGGASAIVLAGVAALVLFMSQGRR